MLTFAANLYIHLKPILAALPIHFSLEGSLVAMFLVLYGSKFVQVCLSFLLLKKYDNVNSSHRYGPKGDQERNADWKQRAVQRAFSAHSNHWEAFISFSVAVLLALFKGVDKREGGREELTLLANAFIHVRLLYNVVFVLAFNEPLSFIRSSVWTVGFVIILRIFTLAVGDSLAL